MKKQPPSISHCKKASFTLIELLVVIAIIAILAAILMPALSSARERGKQSTCTNNLGNMGRAMFMYTDDYGGHLMPGDDGKRRMAW
ncbi:MAG: prepilin-type N-terminal cleavage/methylation domain-containing protein, partial [Lentisphaeria bacterium]|nr:prepilin-type N-terminal cleavage/methylation domain-containing protein [Lentisphaeria bacterium]